MHLFCLHLHLRAGAPLPRGIEGFGLPGSETLKGIVALAGGFPWHSLAYLCARAEACARASAHTHKGLAFVVVCGASGLA